MDIKKYKTSLVEKWFDSELKKKTIITIPKKY